MRSGERHRALSEASAPRLCWNWGTVSASRGLQRASMSITTVPHGVSVRGECCSTFSKSLSRCRGSAAVLGGTEGRNVLTKPTVF